MSLMNRKYFSKDIIDNFVDAFSSYYIKEKIVLCPVKV
ncbi:hypothetical protein CSCA_3174 [Clostridium scatologenes]|uniref:Uncharacterized protein n=1 Tax=Clostridium scatologenes TaxID=1548 RepID=A0A0E3K1U0_CLOSL|nr:hypothetical protein CSCA_3174 [Clostridium scatologenes]